MCNSFTKLVVIHSICKDLTGNLIGNMPISAMENRLSIISVTNKCIRNNKGENRNGSLLLLFGLNR